MFISVQQSKEDGPCWDELSQVFGWSHYQSASSSRFTLALID